MGLSTAAVFAILFSAGISTTVLLFSAQDEYAGVSSYETWESFIRHSEEVRSSIEITQVSSTAGGLMITANNTGNVALDVEHIYLMVNDTWIPEGSYTVTPSTGYWEPMEAVTINHTTSLTGAIAVKVVAGTGVEDRYELVV